jgi:hypothetical protein
MMSSSNPRSPAPRPRNWQPAHRKNNNTPATPSAGDKIDDFEFKDWILDLLTDSRLVCTFPTNYKSPDRTNTLFKGPGSPFHAIIAIISVCERQKSVTLRLLRLLTKSCTAAVKEDERFKFSSRVEEATLMVSLLQGKRSSVFIYLLDLLPPNGSGALDLPSNYPQLYLSLIERAFSIGASPEILFLVEVYGFNAMFSFQTCVLKFFQNRDCQAIISLNRISDSLSLLESRCQDALSLLHLSLEVKSTFGKARNIAGDLKQV